MRDPERGGGAAVRRFLKRIFRLGLLAGIGYAVWRWFESHRSETGTGWEAQPLPSSDANRGPTGASDAALAETSATIPRPVGTVTANGERVEPVDGACPP